MLYIIEIPPCFMIGGNRIEFVNSWPHIDNGYEWRMIRLTLNKGSTHYVVKLVMLYAILEKTQLLN